MQNWEAEVARIIARKERETLDEYRERLKESGRTSPCQHFLAIPPRCNMKHELDCLTCTDYEPQEIPGTWSKGYAVFEYGRVIHLVEDVKSDGFYRCGRTMCGRMLSEEYMAVEIYPLESYSQLEEDTGEPYHGRNVCRKCNEALHLSNLR